MYWDIEVTPEDEDEMIKNIAQKIHKSGFNVAAILMIQGVKPLSFIGAQMGRFFVSPFLLAFDKNVGIGAEKFLQIFEERDNMEKLIKAVEELKREEDEGKKAEKLERKIVEAETGGTQKKRGLRCFLPF